MAQVLQVCFISYLIFDLSGVDNLDSWHCMNLHTSSAQTINNVSSIDVMSPPMTTVASLRRFELSCRFQRFAVSFYFGVLAHKMLTNSPRVFCMEWLDPVYCSGHWVPGMVDIAGGVDKLRRKGTDSDRVSSNDVLEWAPEVLIVIPCGFNLDKVVVRHRISAILLFEPRFIYCRS